MTARLRSQRNSGIKSHHDSKKPGYRSDSITAFGTSTPEHRSSTIDDTIAICATTTTIDDLSRVLLPPRCLTLLTPLPQAYRHYLHRNERLPRSPEALLAAVDNKPPTAPSPMPNPNPPKREGRLTRIPSISRITTRTATIMTLLRQSPLCNKRNLRPATSR
jgi:hypothetical protein